jgi:hypothetical protein
VGDDESGKACVWRGQAEMMVEVQLITALGPMCLITRRRDQLLHGYKKSQGQRIQNQSERLPGRRGGGQ